MALHESGQMYLETIYVLSQKGEGVRSVDVGAHMGFSKPSVSRAVSLLKQDGYITMARNGLLYLTEKGKETAEAVYNRHVILTELLIKLGVDEETAAADACKMEHDISDATTEAIKRFLNK